MQQDCQWIVPEWPAPSRVRALSTLRGGGVSCAPYDTFNLAEHVGDDRHAVTVNRQRLITAAALPSMPLWLKQVHGAHTIHAGEVAGTVSADACFTDRPAQVCAILTADCLPLLICDTQGRRVCALHAGWRGLVNGVVEAAVTALGMPGRDLMAWMGPAIGPDNFEVGDEVRTRFMSADRDSLHAFRPSPQGRWLADIYQLTRLRLERQGVGHIYGAKWCTVSDPERFYSYRRDGKTGRMASMIWLQE